MRAAAKTAVVLGPFLLIFLVLRTCAGGAADRWHDRVRDIDPAARLVVDDESLIVIAPDEESGQWVADEVQEFKAALIADHGDLIGRGREQRMVVVLFSSGDHLRDYAGKGMPFDPEWTQQMHGYTDSSQGAIFVPPGSSPGTLRHETVHWIVTTSAGPEAELSPWLNEGLAQLFETYEPGRSWRPIGSGDRWALRTLLQSDTIDVDRLLALTDYRDFVVNNGHRNYLESLVLIAFLFEQRDRELLRRYLDAERASRSGRELEFRRIYAHHEPAFQRDLRAYVRQLQGR